MALISKQWACCALLAGLQCWWTTPAAAQVAPARTADAPKDAGANKLLFRSLRFDRITGMTKGAVSAIAQDGSGLIWFGTEEGLSRYDGYEFVNYVPGQDQQNTLSNFTVTSLAASKDALWIGTIKGLNRLELGTNKFSVLKTNAQDAKSIASDDVRALHLGKSGLLWIGTADAGVDSLNPATGELRHYRSTANRNDSLSGDSISVIWEDKDGKVWIGTRETGLNRLDPASGKVTRYLHDPDRATTLSNDNVTSIYQDNAGTLWVATLDGLNRFDPAANTFKRYLKGPEGDPRWITTIVEGADGGLWLGVKGIGVFRFDRRSSAIERYTHDSGDANSISHPWTRVAFSDRGGVLWFGFNAGGVSKLNLMRRDFGFYRTDPGLAFLEDGDHVWLGTQGRGLRSLNVKSGEVTSYLDEELRATWTMKIAHAEPGSLWLGTTDRGLFHYTPRTGKLDVYDTEGGSLASDAIFALLRDRESLWVGTYGAGLARLDTSKKTVEYFTSDAANAVTMSSDNVTAVHQDRTKPEILWIGTADGLNKFDKRNGRVERFLHDPAKPASLSHNHVTDIYEDRAGQLWIATWGGGLNRLGRDTGTFTAFHTAQGLASDVIYGILEDKSGALWITTNDGLTKFEPKTTKPINFRVGDGLQDDEFGQGGFHQGPSGRFYVGGPRGFNVFIPEELTPDSYVPPLVMTKFDLAGESRAVPSEVALSFRDRWFSVGFSALAYASPAQNRYKYRLTGFHDWIETDRRFVSYSSLPPGDYTLEILGSNAHGVWNEDGIRLPIHVRPPPWRTWWAYLGYCAIVAVIVFLFVRRQRKQLDALQRAHRLSELEREMALTSAVQEGFFPTTPSVHDGGFRLEGFYRAASQCSGDWWWYEVRGDDYFILVGDVTGHGAGSAMVTAAAAACFRSLGTRVDDDTRLQEMNDEVLRVSRGQYLMTLTAVNVNVATGHFVIRSAGGVPVFSLPPFERAKVHMCPGMPLGSPDFQIGRLEGTLTPGERVLILTDGISEVSMANTQLLGPRGVANFYMQTRDHELKTALQQLIHKVEMVQAGGQDDDWTAVMLQWGAPDPNMEREITAMGTIPVRPAS